MILAQQGFPIDPTKPPTPQDLKDPILWLCQANALQEAAVVLVKNEPSFDKMPSSVRGMCDTQYCAVALMLIGYSLDLLESNDHHASRDRSLHCEREGLPPS